MYARTYNAAKLAPHLLTIAPAGSGAGGAGWQKISGIPRRNRPVNTIKN